MPIAPVPEATVSFPAVHFLRGGVFLTLDSPFELSCCNINNIPIKYITFSGKKQNLLLYIKIERIDGFSIRSDICGQLSCCVAVISSRYSFITKKRTNAQK